MGAQTSVEIAKPFMDISKWSKSRLDSVLQGYVEGEYDFGIDITALKSITGYNNEEGKELLQALTKNETGMVNAVTLMFVLVCMGNSDHREEVQRVETIFDIMDFNKAECISFDELTIMLLCLVSAFSYILEGKIGEDKQIAYEQTVLLHARHIYETLGNRRTNATITKDEFVQYVKDEYFTQGIVYINDVLKTLVAAPGANARDEDGSNKGTPVRK
jgi:hypothetical protein